MNTLYSFTESYTNGFLPESLDIISLISILCGIFVIVSKNPIVSVLFLIGLFLSISSYLILLGLNFIGLSYLLVYVGAVSILFLFILMLINVRVSELLNDTSNSIPLAVIIAILFNDPLYQILPYSITGSNSYVNNTDSIFVNNIFYNTSYYVNNLFKAVGSGASEGKELSNNEIFFVSSKLWDGNLSETSHITSIGNILYTSHSMWLILTSFILLLAMVGAIVITIKQKN